MSKLVVLTGATRGLGRALVPHFVQRGWTVAGCGRSADAVADLAAQFPAPHAFAAVDVASDAAVKAWAADVLAKLGPPDLLVNNAALINEAAPLWAVPAAEFDALIDVNVKGVANVIRHFVPAMVARRSGVIVNLSSGWGRSAEARVGPYCASKFAVEGLTRSLAQELPVGMAAVPLNPGVIDTDMLRQWRSGSQPGHESPAAWAERAAPFILGLGPKDNGQSLNVPGR